MTNDQFLFFPMLSYSYKNTVGAVARLFFSDPPLTPHANTADEMHYRYSPLIKESLLSGVSVFHSHAFADSLYAVQEIGWH